MEPRRQLEHRVFWQDKRWLAAHAEASSYRRPYVPGEFCLADDDVETRALLDSVSEVEVWWAEGAAHGRPPQRFRRAVGVDGVWTDAEDEANWMLHAGPTGDA
jgi:hypothetical protein